MAINATEAREIAKRAQKDADRRALLAAGEELPAVLRVIQTQANYGEHQLRHMTDLGDAACHHLCNLLRESGFQASFHLKNTRYGKAPYACHFLEKNELIIHW